jgi:hypothetical protein
MGVVSGNAHAALRILLEAFPRRMSKRAMDRAFHNGEGWRLALDRLREKDQRWRDALAFPTGKPPRGGYGIVDIRASEQNPGKMLTPSGPDGHPRK